MRRPLKIVALAVLTAVSLGGGTAAVARTGDASSSCDGSCAASATATATSATATSSTPEATRALSEVLAANREEERMARDLYRLFADTYDDARPFSNIVHSEQRHFDAVGRLISRYGVADPSAGKSAGTYADPQIQKSYDAWKAQGLKSLAQANQVGVDLEKEDIAGLKESLTKVEQADVQQVLRHLLAGSEHHLQAFTRAAERGSAQGTGQDRDGPGMSHRRGMSQGMGPGGVGPGGIGTGDGTGRHQGEDTDRRDGMGPGRGMGPGQGGAGERRADCPLAT